MTGDVLTFVDGAAGRIRLNRPGAIHALTLDMVHAMTKALVAWRDDARVTHILIDHADGRGFCAGGDIAFLRNSALHDDGVSGRRFFHDEYRLNHLIFTYAKPVVAFMDGITMGGGVGISQPARFRVATPATRLAMPETGIGLFPDVGGGWYLSRLAGRLGQYLALTGARLDGADCHHVGLASHFLSGDAIEAAKRALVAGDDVASSLDALAERPGDAPIDAHLDDIAGHFAADAYEDILASLAQDSGDWAASIRHLLDSKSPQTCKVALRQLHDSLSCADFADNMRMEYRIASRVLTRPDFAEGVRAVIVDKTNDPEWNPATPAGVTDALIDAIFAPLPANDEWTPL
ncbi:MAG: enoyl-CoA hydratase/isomerase family protein [Sphingomonadaceae bacterium]|nr:enoyl-CoA hydratase/isomerase family protein [Sphingomonadaceae bacterium]